MIRLLAVKFFISYWKRAIEVSRKLKPATWVLLAAIQCALFILSVWGFQQTRETRISTVANADLSVAVPSVIKKVNDSSAKVNGISVAEVSPFVRQQYIDFLGREPDPIGYQGWLDILDNCVAGDKRCDQVEVSAGFFRSEEFRNRGYFIYRLYSDALVSDAQSVSNKAAFQAPIVILQMASPDSSNPKENNLFWLICAIVSATNTISATIIAWISLNRSKANLLLTKAALKKAELEMEKLRLEIASARQEAAEQKPSIIIASS